MISEGRRSVVDGAGLSAAIVPPERTTEFNAAKCLDEHLVSCVAEAEAKSNEPLSKFTRFFGPASKIGYLDNIDPTFVGNDPRARKALDAENAR